MVPAGKYIVAGCSGLVGSHALKRLSDQSGVHVKGIYNSNPPHVSAGNIDPVQADLTKGESCREHIRDADYLVLCAGVVNLGGVGSASPVLPAISNFLITSQCLEAALASGIRKAVWFSSTVGYPETEGPIREDRMFEGEPPTSYSAMGWTFRCLERLSESMVEEGGGNFSCLVLRPSLIYGEHDHFSGDKAHFLPAFIRRVVEREFPLEVWGGGTEERDVVHASDVIKAALLALENKTGFDAYNVAYGQSYSVNHVLESILRIEGLSDVDINRLPGKNPGLKKRQFCIDKAASELGYSPSVDLEEGLRRTMQWYRTNHKNQFV